MREWDASCFLRELVVLDQPEVAFVDIRDLLLLSREKVNNKIDSHLAKGAAIILKRAC